MRVGQDTSVLEEDQLQQEHEDDNTDDGRDSPCLTHRDVEYFQSETCRPTKSWRLQATEFRPLPPVRKKKESCQHFLFQLFGNNLLHLK